MAHEHAYPYSYSVGRRTLNRMSLFVFTELKNAYAARHEPEQYVSFARTFWSILLAVTAALIVACVAFGAWQFIFLKGEVSDVPPPAGITGFNKEQLRLIVTAFENRQSEFETLMSEK